MKRCAWLLLLATVLAGRPVVHAEAVSIAAAANLVFAMEALNRSFRETAPDVTVTLATGASGSLFAQIKHGAPYDVFLSADTEYPQQLVAAKLADANTLQTFATGRLVLWTTRADLPMEEIGTAVRDSRVKRLAIAQPRTAPYGRAALATLEKLDLWRAVEPRIVYGENISQTAQFVETGNADLGFVAMSLVLSSRLTTQGRWLEVPPASFASVSLDHAAVLTLHGVSNPAAQRYLKFLGSTAAKKILRDFGYGVK